MARDLTKEVLVRAGQALRRDPAQRGRALCFAVAAGAAALATGLQALLGPSMWSLEPFLPFLLGVMLSAWFGGFAPGMLATVLGCVASTYFLRSTPGSAGLPLALLIVLFLVVGAVVSSLFEKLHGQTRRLGQLLEAEQRAREEAELANRRRDEFLAALSHELRNPLNAIVGWAHVLQAAPLEPAEVAQGVEAILRSARSQTRLIEDLHDLSRILSGKMHLNFLPVELRGVVESAISSARTAAEAKAIHLQASLAPVGRLDADAERLQQALRGLLTSALRSTPPGGVVEISLDQQGAEARIVVKDNGAGLSADLLPLTFERFFHPDSSSRRQFGSLGLELAIARGLVELHRGTLRAESAGEGKGTAFFITLPATVPSPGALGRSPMAPNGPLLLEGLRVLVVEDDSDTRALIETILAGHKALVKTAASAAEGLREVSDFRPDVLLSDIGMPEQDGFDLIRSVRALGPDHGGGIPAAALTAFVRGEDRQRALDAGFQVHVPKPIGPADLVRVVADLAGRRAVTSGH